MNNDLIGFLLLLLLLSPLPVYWWISSKRSAVKRRSLNEGMREHFERMAGWDTWPSRSDVMALQADEYSIAETRATFFELRRSGRTNMVGTRVKVAGIPIYLGQSKVDASEDWKDAGAGTLCVTSKRVLFVGGARTFSVKHSEIVAVDAARRQIRLSVSRRQKPVAFECAAAPVMAILMRGAMDMPIDGPPLSDAWRNYLASAAEAFGADAS